MNNTRTLLTDTCARLFTDQVTPALIESAEKGAWPAALWQILHHMQVAVLILFATRDLGLSAGAIGIAGAVG